MMIKKNINAVNSWLNNFRNRISLSKKGIHVHRRCNLGHCTKIGYGTVINGPAYIASDKNAPVVIGKYCAIAYNLRIRPINHDANFINLHGQLRIQCRVTKHQFVKGPVIIGNNVWIGDNVIILSGVNVGDGAVLGAGAVVTKDVPAYAIAAGNPAKVIKMRFSDNITEQLTKIKWWDWPKDKIKRNKQFFETDFSKCPQANLAEIIVD